MKKICLITGANGYIGANLSTYMEVNGWDVIKLQREIKTNTSSISFSLGHLDDSKIPNKIDLLIHCAHDFDNLSINIEGTINLYDIVKKHGDPKIIFISSISVINGCTSKYSFLKSKIEEITKKYGGTSIRLGLVYGPGAGGMFGKISKFIKLNIFIPVIGSGNEKMYTTFICDLCEFIVKLAQIPNFPKGKVYSAFSQEPIIFYNLILELVRYHKKRKYMIIKIPPKLIIIGFRIFKLLNLKIAFNEDNLRGIQNSNFPNGMGEFNLELGNFSKFDRTKLEP